MISNDVMLAPRSACSAAAIAAAVMMMASVGCSKPAADKRDPPPTESATATAPTPATATPAPTAEAKEDPCDINSLDDCVKKCQGGSARACGFADGIMQTRAKEGQTVDQALRAKVNDLGCKAADLQSCSRLGTQYEKGEGVPKDQKKALALWSDACTKGYANSCGFVGFYYSYPGDDHPQDLEKALSWYKKGCDGGKQNDCKNVAEIESGKFPQVVAIEDLAATPKKYIGKQVILLKVAAVRVSPSSGLVFKRGGSPNGDGINTIVPEDNEDARKAWIRIKTMPGQNVKQVEATCEEEMRRGGGLRLVLLDLEAE